ncbi:MAG TPA: hypothetical protein VJL54_05765 [Nitrososphaera sp.]|nr:hypothetical protein [Nitrososphaera sp.]
MDATAAFAVIMAVVLGIGLVQGGVISKALRARFPRLKQHGKFFSLALLALFGINAIFSATSFASPTKMSGFDNPLETGDFGAWAMSALGLNGGFLSMLSISVTIIIFVLMRFVKLGTKSRYFVLTVSVSVLVINIFYRLSEVVPDFYQIMFYVVYQVGVAAGVFLVASRELGFGRRILSGMKSGFTRDGRAHDSRGH